jgi:hypothetical protein
VIPLKQRYFRLRGLFILKPEKLKEKVAVDCSSHYLFVNLNRVHLKKQIDGSFNANHQKAIFIAKFIH